MSYQNKILQTQFFEKIKDATPQNQSMVEDLSDLLNISRDSVYRRIRNATSLSLEEIVKICNYYKISFDLSEPQSANSVSFTYNQLKNKEDFKNYLLNILEDLKAIAGNVNKQIIYAAIDIPIFHHFQFPELAAFKMFYWIKSVINDQLVSGKKFSFDFIDPQMLELGQEIYKYYRQIPTVEIWTTETINSQIEQIQFFWESGLFETKEDALKICKLTEEELILLQHQADCGSKVTDATSRPENSFKLYQSEIEIGNNCIITQRGQSKAVYLSFHLLNYMVTYNSEFCHQTQDWADNLMKKSVLISEVSEKLRYKFFKNGLEKIKKVMVDIEEF